jgi:hypothetical protein
MWDWDCNGKLTAALYFSEDVVPFCVNAAFYAQRALP